MIVLSDWVSRVIGYMVDVVVLDSCSFTVRATHWFLTPCLQSLCCECVRVLSCVPDTLWILLGLAAGNIRCKLREFQVLAAEDWNAAYLARQSLQPMSWKNLRFFPLPATPLGHVVSSDRSIHLFRDRNSPTTPHKFILPLILKSRHRKRAIQFQLAHSLISSIT